MTESELLAKAWDIMVLRDTLIRQINDVKMLDNKILSLIQEKEHTETVRETMFKERIETINKLNNALNL